MSISPFMTPGQSRQRRASSARRRRRRRMLLAALLLLVAVAAIAVARGDTSTGSDRHGARGARAGARAVPAPAARHSQTGLALGQPPLKLSGAGDAQQDPVRVAFSDPPRAGILFNLSTGRVLWQRNPYTVLPMASLTKMMTALLTVESAPPNAPVRVTREAVNADGSKVGVLPLGKHVRLESMLYGLLLPSGNDAAVALAQHVAGSVNRFVLRMNAEAAKLGLGCTRYSSPSGYYDRGNYTCAADLAELAHTDLQQPRIAAVTRTYSAVLPFPIKG